MKYPKITVILRNVNIDEAEKLLNLLINYRDYFAVEITLNTPDSLSMIKNLNDRYGDKILIGAGTVKNFSEAKSAILSGAKFLLGPCVFSDELISLAKINNVLSIPGAFTPSEVQNQFELGADIVKIFPASSLQLSYFKDIQAPLGRLRLMAVGGVGYDNFMNYLANGCDYVGIGSALLEGKKIRNCTEEEIDHMLKRYVLKLEGEIFE